MDDLKNVLLGSWELLTMPFTIYGYELSFFGIMVFVTVTAGIIWLLMEAIR